jgi:phosphatidylinositol glycan class Q protein
MLKSNIQWLMGSPAGFKLNENLDRFLGSVFLFYIERWATIMNFIISHGISLSRAVGVIFIMGTFSVGIGLLQDLFWIFTFHLMCFYTAAARIYHLQLNILSSLWKLFRGKKYNPLKERIDHENFDMDQLLLGTIFFTLTFFLLPTTFIYYSFFTIVRIAVGILPTFSAFLLKVIHHFPVIPLIYYLLDNSYLPGKNTRRRRFSFLFSFAKRFVVARGNLLRSLLSSQGQLNVLDSSQ